MTAPALLGRHPQTGTGEHVDPETRERVRRVGLDERPSPEHVRAYVETKAAERREAAAAAEVVRLRAELDRVRRELADAVDVLTARRAASVAAWDAEQRAAFG